jgi:hypothetical protein
MRQCFFIETISLCIGISKHVLEEMDKFIDLYDLLKLSQETINYLNRPLTSNEIEALIESPKKNSQEQDGSWLNYSRLFKKNLHVSQNISLCKK